MPNPTKSLDQLFVAMVQGAEATIKVTTTETGSETTMSNSRKKKPSDVMLRPMSGRPMPDRHPQPPEVASVPFVCTNEEHVRLILKAATETARHIKNVGGARPWAAYSKSGLELARFRMMEDAVTFAAAFHALGLLRRNLSRARRELAKVRQTTMFDGPPSRGSGHGDTD